MGTKGFLRGHRTCGKAEQRVAQGFRDYLREITFEADEKNPKRSFADFDCELCCPDAWRSGHTTT
jgi:hypothetical protein